METILQFDNNDVGAEVDERQLPQFDRTTNGDWYYPTNYPVRDYQYTMVQVALLQNTLVSLPTGLGKTFIAAVLMYNYYRWFPDGVVIFMAPTRPLVGQQIEACYNITGICKEDTAELTGSTKASDRAKLYATRRMLFMTSQVLVNDLASGTCDAKRIVCLVFDEAHKASGNSAYCQVIRAVTNVHRRFRILGLSATPGDQIEKVRNVIENLLITRLEYRTDDSLDIQKYIHSRKVEVITVKLNKTMQDLRTRFERCMRDPLNALVNTGAFHTRSPENVSHFALLQASHKYQANPLPGTDRGQIIGLFVLCQTLAHAFNLMTTTGVMSFYTYMKGYHDGQKNNRLKGFINNNVNMQLLLKDIKRDFDQSDDEAEPNGKPKNPKYPSNPETPFDTTKTGISSKSQLSHPKFIKLASVLDEHFLKNGKDSRVMVFAHYRDTVVEIVKRLKKEPNFKVSMFIGQSDGKNHSGLKQREQLEVLSKFRAGELNVLVSTSVGEEGLDIGDLDLIICFDAQQSHTRLVQRMGRTGRKRQGHVVMLVTEGREAAKYNNSLRTKNGISKVINKNRGTLPFYALNADMVPPDVELKCRMVNINVTAPFDRNYTTGRGQRTSKALKSPADGGLTAEEELACAKAYGDCGPIQSLKLHAHLSKQKRLSSVNKATHTHRTHTMAKVLQLIDDLIIDPDTVDGFMADWSVHLYPHDVYALVLSDSDCPESPLPRHRKTLNIPPQSNKHSASASGTSVDSRCCERTRPVQLSRTHHSNTPHAQPHSAASEDEIEYFITDDGNASHAPGKHRQPMGNKQKQSVRSVRPTVSKRSRANTVEGPMCKKGKLAALDEAMFSALREAQQVGTMGNNYEVSDDDDDLISFRTHRNTAPDPSRAHAKHSKAPAHGTTTHTMGSPDIHHTTAHVTTYTTTHATTHTTNAHHTEDSDDNGLTQTESLDRWPGPLARKVSAISISDDDLSPDDEMVHPHRSTIHKSPIGSPVALTAQPHSVHATYTNKHYQNISSKEAHAASPNTFHSPKQCDIFSAWRTQDTTALVNGHDDEITETHCNYAATDDSPQTDMHAIVRAKPSTVDDCAPGHPVCTPEVDHEPERIAHVHTPTRIHDHGSRLQDTAHGTDMHREETTSAHNNTHSNAHSNIHSNTHSNTHSNREATPTGTHDRFLGNASQSVAKRTHKVTSITGAATDGGDHGTMGLSSERRSRGSKDSATATAHNGNGNGKGAVTAHATDHCAWNTDDSHGTSDFDFEFNSKTKETNQTLHNDSAIARGSADKDSIGRQQVTSGAVAVDGHALTDARDDGSDWDDDELNAMCDLAEDSMGLAERANGINVAVDRTAPRAQLLATLGRADCYADARLVSDGHSSDHSEDISDRIGRGFDHDRGDMDCFSDGIGVSDDEACADALAMAEVAMGLSNDMTYPTHHSDHPKTSAANSSQHSDPTETSAATDTDCRKSAGAHHGHLNTSDGYGDGSDEELIVQGDCLELHTKISQTSNSNTLTRNTHSRQPANKHFISHHVATNRGTHPKPLKPINAHIPQHKGTAMQQPNGTPSQQPNGAHARVAMVTDVNESFHWDSEIDDADWESLMNDAHGMGRNERDMRSQHLSGRRTTPRTRAHGTARKGYSPFNAYGNDLYYSSARTPSHMRKPHTPMDNSQGNHGEPHDSTTDTQHTHTRQAAHDTATTASATDRMTTEVSVDGQANAAVTTTTTTNHRASSTAQQITASNSSAANATLASAALGYGGNSDTDMSVFLYDDEIESLMRTADTKAAALHTHPQAETTQTYTETRTNTRTDRQQLPLIAQQAKANAIDVDGGDSDGPPQSIGRSVGDVIVDLTTCDRGCVADGLMAGAGSNSTHTMTHVTDTNTPHPHTTTAPPHQPPTQRALAPQRHRQTTNHSHNTGQPSDRNTRTRTQPTTTEYSQPAAKRAPSTSLSSLNTSGFASPSPIVARRKPRTGPQVIQFTPTPNKTPRTQTHTHQHGEAGVVSAIESPTCAIDLDTSIHTHTYAHPHPHPPTHTTGAHGSADNRRLGHTANAPSGGESGQAHGAPISTPSQSRVRFVLSSQSSELPQRHKRRVGYRRVIADDDSCMENPTNASIGSGDAEAADTRVKCHADDRPSTDGDRMRRQSQSQRPRKKALKLKRGAAPANYTQALSIETIPKGPNSLVQYNVPFYVDPAQKALVEENKKNQRRRERKWKKVNDLLFDEFASESDGRGGRRNIDSSDDSSGSDSDDALESSFINDSYTQTQGSYQYRDLNKHMHEEDENESYAHQMAAAHGYGRVDTDAVVAKTVLPDTPQHNIRLHKSRFFSSDDDIDAYESEGIDDAEEDADTSAVLSAMDESTSLEDELADLGVDDDSWWVKAARREKRKKDSVNNATLARMRKSREQQQLTTARGASCKVTGPIVPDVRSVAGTYIIRIVQSDIHDAGRRKAIGHTMNQTLRTATHVHCVLEQSPPILPMDTLTTRFVASLIADVRIHVTSSDSKEDSQHIMDRIIRSLT